MKTGYRKPFILALLFLILSGFMLSAVYAQETTSTCAENLLNAQSMFDRGQVEQVQGLLAGCLKSGFTREEQLTAYKLIIQTLLFEDKLEQADSAMLSFLKTNPEYELSPTDHSSFVTLYNTFRVKPVLQLSIHLGTDVPFITFIDEASLSSEPPDKKYSTTFLNFYGSIEAKIKLTQRFDLSIDPGFSQLKFKNREVFTDLLSGITDYTESQSRIELPVILTCNFNSFGKLTPYARIGGGTSMILNARGTAKYTPADVNNPNDIPQSQADRTDSRISLDYFVQIGGGVKYKTRGGYFFGELRSNAGILNQVINGGGSHQEISFRYYYTDDYAFHLNAVNFNLGYTQIFYKPSKRRE